MRRLIVLRLGVMVNESGYVALHFKLRFWKRYVVS